MFESRISAGDTENLSDSGKVNANGIAWSYDMEGHQETETSSNCTESPHLVSMITSSRQRSWKRWDNCKKVRSEIFLKCHKLARATNWTRASEKRLARLGSYIHFTSSFRQYCHVGNIAAKFRLGLVQDSDLAGDLEDSKSTSGGVLCLFGSRTFVPTR